jgi:ribonuclease HII
LGSEGLDLVVDRHGGRKRYGELLGGTLGDARVTTVAEARVRSEYTACGVCASSDGRSMRVAFAEKADGSSFTVALASCLAKYAREVCMRAFNDCFGALEPALRPTAGYVTDARRWLAEARAAIERLGIPRSELVRER